MFFCLLVWFFNKGNDTTAVQREWSIPKNWNVSEVFHKGGRRDVSWTLEKREVTLKAKRGKSQWISW